MSLCDYFKMDVDINDCEYDAQLFGFNANYFMRAIRLLVKQEVTYFTESMTAAVMKKYSSDDPEIEQVKKVTKSLIDQYICASIEPLKLLESQLKELLHIPAHVLLPEDSYQRAQYSAEDETEVDKQVLQLLQRLKRTKTFDVELRKELKMLRDTLPLLKHRVSECQQFVSEFQETDKHLKDLEPSADDMITDKLEFLDINKEL